MITLNNGLPVTIRPARPDDAPMLHRMYQQTSRNSLYQRYIRAYTPDMETIQAMCSMKPDEGAVFVACLDNHTIIGYAYYVRENDRMAEPALLITDRYQGLGLGKHLIQTMLEHALSQGIDTFHATIDGANERMMHLIRRGGKPFKSEISYGMREIYIQLAA